MFYDCKPILKGCDIIYEALDSKRLLLSYELPLVLLLLVYFAMFGNGTAPT